MKVSIITATYNSAKTISDTIESVYNQNYEDIEHIIIDGKSEDNTLEIIKNMPNRVSQIISERDKGIYDAMNKGITLAEGDVIGILNSDDFYFSDNIISDVVKEFKQNNCEAVYGDLRYVDERNTDKIIRYWKSKQYSEGLFRKGWHPAHPTFFVKREVYEKFGVFNLKYRIAADYEIMLRFIERYKIKTSYIPKVFVKMRIGGESNRNLKNIIKSNQESLLAWRDNGLELPVFLLLRKPLSKIIQYIRR